MNDNEQINIQSVVYLVDTSTTQDMEQLCISDNRYPIPKDKNTSCTEKQILYFKYLVDNLYNALERQISTGRIVTQDSTLTIFSLPEFYFKDRQGYIFCNAAKDAGLKYMSEKLVNLTKKNLLVLPGTIWSWEDYIDTSQTLKMVNNIAPIFFNGTLLNVWSRKNIASSECFPSLISNSSLPLTKEEMEDLYLNYWKTLVPDYVDYEVDSVPQQSDAYTKLKNSYFDIHVVNGTSTITVKVGIETTLDHSLGFLKSKSLEQNIDVDIHILICNGIFPNTDHIACRNNGLFVRCDRIDSSTYSRRNSLNWYTGNDCSVITNVRKFSSAGKTFYADDSRIVIYDSIILKGKNPTTSFL